MNRMDALIHRRASARKSAAQACAARIVEDAKRHDVDITVIGSLAKGSFGVHSDVDLLVLGTTNPGRRAMVERLVANHMRGGDIPYDLIFESDISAERLRELIHESV